MLRREGNSSRVDPAPECHLKHARDLHEAHSLLGSLKSVLAGLPHVVPRKELRLRKPQDPRNATRDRGSSALRATLLKSIYKPTYLGLV